ncbi:MAG: hypothetical protein HZC40_09080 [Chloroflexi bacterium]|nr:hypothetical protein [Chloroflexota bacterium]
MGEFRFLKYIKSNLRIALQALVYLSLAIGFIIAFGGMSESPLRLYANVSAQSAVTRTPVPLPSRTHSPTAPPLRRISPTLVRPNQAHSSIPGQTQVDANTIALYHFDAPNGGVVIDATGNFTGTLVGDATIVPGLYSGALSTSGNNSYARTGYLGNLSAGTIEAFVDFVAACSGVESNFAIISAVNESTGKTVLYLGEHTGLVFGVFVNGAWLWANSGINSCRYLNGPYPPAGPLWPYETWRFHHVAATWGPRGTEIWVDGVLHGVGTNDPNAGIAPYPYSCNPQSQMASSTYPRCSTPVMLNQMLTPVLPPGNYVGGLPPYTTLRIGGDMDGLYFRGRIDEVRVSNLQRTFDSTVVPTTTPTPTSTPVYITGEYAVDAYTLSLFHLNSLVPSGILMTTLDQVSGQYFGIGGSSPFSLSPGGRYNSALYLGGNAYLDMGAVGAPIAGVVEMWVNLSATANLMPLMTVSESPYSNGSKLFLGAPNSSTLQFGLDDGETFYWLDSGVPMTTLVGGWHHVAGTWGARGLEIWVDGIRRNVNPAVTGGLHEPIYRYRVGCDPGTNCILQIEWRELSKIKNTRTANVLACFLILLVKKMVLRELVGLVA